MHSNRSFKFKLAILTLLSINYTFARQVLILGIPHGYTHVYLTCQPGDNFKEMHITPFGASTDVNCKSKVVVSISKNNGVAPKACTQEYIKGTLIWGGTCEIVSTKPIHS